MGDYDAMLLSEVGDGELERRIDNLTDQINRTFAGSFNDQMEVDAILWRFERDDLVAERDYREAVTPEEKLRVVERYIQTIEGHIENFDDPFKASSFDYLHKHSPARRQRLVVMQMLAGELRSQLGLDSVDTESPQLGSLDAGI